MELTVLLLALYADSGYPHSNCHCPKGRALPETTAAALYMFRTQLFLDKSTETYR